MTRFLLLIAMLIATNAKTQKPECDPKAPHFTAGDFNITMQNYQQYAKQTLIMGISDSDCKDCCYLETMLNKIGELMQIHKYKQQALKIARIDIKFMRGSWPIDKLDHQSTMPKVAILKNNRIYEYNSYLHYPLLLYYINKVLYPVLPLNSIAQIETFIDTESEYVEENEFYPAGTYEKIGASFPGNPRKVLMLVKDMSEYKEQVKKYKEAAQKMSYRPELRFALVIDPNAVTETKKKHPEWFGQYSTNSIVLINGKNQYACVQLAEFELYNLENWLNEESLRPVIPIDAHTAVIFEKIILPKILAYTNDDNSKYITDMIRRVSSGHHEFIMCTTTEEYVPRGKPSLVATLRSGATYYYPTDVPLTDTNIDTFLLNITTQSIKSTYTLSRVEQGEEATSILKHTPLLRIGEFNDTVKGSKEILLLLVDTRYSLDAKVPAQEFDNVAVKLRSQEGIKVVYFDMLLDRAPEQFERVIPPAVYLYLPSYKGEAQLKMDGEIEEDNIMRFLRRNSKQNIKADL